MHLPRWVETELGFQVFEEQSETHKRGGWKRAAETANGRSDGIARGGDGADLGSSPTAEGE